jgi:hypothetical protein
MRRLQVVATVVVALALALLLAGWRIAGDGAAGDRVAAKQRKLDRAYEEGIDARASMDKLGQRATHAECEARFFAGAVDLDDMVELTCEYFVAGCMKQPRPARAAEAP